MYFTCGHQQLVFVHSNSVSSQHNTTHHQQTNATLEQDDTKTCLAVDLCVDFMVVICVQKSPQSNMMPTDITGDQTCMFRTEQIWSTMTCGVTDKASVSPETAWTNWQTEKLPVPGVGGKPYSLVTGDLHFAVEEAGAWNWPHLNPVQKFTIHGNNKCLDLWSHTWRRA
jgi:hypothetical protein